MTDEVELPDEHQDAAPVIASWLVRVVVRQDGTTTAATTPTNAQIEEAIRTMVGASWHGLAVTATAERTDR